MAEDDTERTEEATPQRRQKAREEGQFPRARDTGPLAATIAVLLLVGSSFSEYADLLRGFCLRCFQEPLTLARGELSLVMKETIAALVVGCLPVAVAAMVAGTAAGFAEAGFHPNLELASPKWERLDPIGRLQTMFSPKAGAVSTLLSLARVGVIAVVTYKILASEFSTLVSLGGAPLSAAASELGRIVFRLAIWSTLALAMTNAVDFIQAWFKHYRSIRMSRQEIKEEMQQQEGSPQIRARQRARARENLRRSIRKQVAEATVVVTNPTHVAVALRYKASEGAPIVAAKGYDDIAQHIKAVAAEKGIPMVENVPLARALAERVRVGRVIPADLYVAVAEVLAFVYRIRARGMRA